MVPGDDGSQGQIHSGQILCPLFGFVGQMRGSATVESLPVVVIEGIHTGAPVIGSSWDR